MDVLTMGSVDGVNLDELVTGVYSELVTLGVWVMVTVVLRCEVTSVVADPLQHEEAQAEMVVVMVTVMGSVAEARALRVQVSEVGVAWWSVVPKSEGKVKSGLHGGCTVATGGG